MPNPMCLPISVFSLVIKATRAKKYLQKWPILKLFIMLLDHTNKEKKHSNSRENFHFAHDCMLTLP